MAATVRQPPLLKDQFDTTERPMTADEAFQDVCCEIDSLCQHGPGTNPAGLASAIDELIDAKIREID